MQICGKLLKRPLPKARWVPAEKFGAFFIFFVKIEITNDGKTKDNNRLRRVGSSVTGGASDECELLMRVCSLCNVKLCAQRSVLRYTQSLNGEKGTCRS
jgi:hypothetical protein